MDRRDTQGRRPGRRFAAFITMVVIAAVAVVGYFMFKGSVDVLSPVGTIGRQQRQLIYLALGLSLLVVIPVFVMTFVIAWRYRATNPRGHYSPEFDHSIIAESIWWAIPIILISILAVITWRTTHTLDPKIPIASSQKTLTVQVIALEWRWLFLYPDQQIASLNYVEMPVGRPVHFEITSDAPMNSFWLPKLGGQIYAMSGMSTNLNLIADKPGNYRGMSANLSGDGFAGMTFEGRAVSQADFDAWAEDARMSAGLTAATYKSLARQSTDKTSQSFALADTNLYHEVIDTYMAPSTEQTSVEAKTNKKMTNMPNMQMSGGMH